jgi:protein-disulfide isomerase
MYKMTHRFSRPLLALSALAIFSCTQGRRGDSGKIVSTLPDGEVILKYNGGSITAKDVNDMVKSRLSNLNEEAIEIYQRSAEHTLLNKLLKDEATKQGLSGPEELLAKAAASVEVSDDRVKSFIKENNLEKGYKDPVTGKSRKITPEEIKAYLAEQERQNAREVFLQGLLAKAEVKMLIEEPRVEIKIPAGAHVLGDAKSKVVVHEFSDFQCPYCSRAHATVKQLNQHYGNKIAIVYHHLPLPSHPEARPSAIASNCAGKEGKFWPFHDKLFENQRALSQDNYLKWATEVGLNVESFKACLSDPAMAKQVEESVQFAEGLGINSTPTFYVNGKKLAGAQPFEQFQRVIETELK